jgi:hypothetical protein
VKDKLLTSFGFAAVLVALTSTAIASTTWYVNGVSGSNSNACTSSTTACKTIGHAISLAASGDSVMVAAATYPEHLTISISLKILGSGAKTTILNGGGSLGRVVTISSAAAHVTLSGVTITNGFSFRDGAGIINNGVLILLRSAVSGNLTQFPCRSGQQCVLRGGGIFNAAGAILTIGNSTVSGNHLSIPGCSVFDCATAGGGIYNGGTLVLYNSTISGNTAGPGAHGSGIYNGGTATIRNSTLSGNGPGVGAGIDGTATVENSIVANGIQSTNCDGTVTSNGYNLSSDDSCNFTNAGDLNNTDPMLGPLQYNGGPTQTMALPSGSPAVDAGNPNGCTDNLGHLLKTDQRGKPRPDAEETAGCDMGAYEYQAQQGHCVWVCGSTRCGMLTGYCAGSVNGACRRTYDPAQCPVGKPAGGSGSSCGETIDTTRTCTP